MIKFVIDSLFLWMPMSELPMLPVSSRMDMLDYYEAKMEARGENIYGGVSVLTQKDERSLTVKLTEVSTWKMEALEDGSVRCTHRVEVPGGEDCVETRNYAPAVFMRRE